MFLAPLWRILWASVPALTPTWPQAAELSLHAGTLARSTPEGSWGCSACPEAPPNAHVTAAAAGTPWGPGAPATGHCRGGGGENTAGVKPGQVVPGPQLPWGSINPPGVDLKGPASSMVPGDPPLQIAGGQGYLGRALRCTPSHRRHRCCRERAGRGQNQALPHAALCTCPQGDTAGTAASTT